MIFQGNRLPPRPIFKRKSLKFVGYIRPSINKCDPERMINLFEKAGCRLIFQEVEDQSSGMKNNSQLKGAMKALKRGDVLLVFHLSHLAESNEELLNLLLGLQKQGIGVQSLDGLVDTQKIAKSSLGLIGFFLALSQIDQSKSGDFSNINLTSSSKGYRNVGGRPKTNKAKAELVLRLRKEACSYRSISDQTSLSVSTIRRIVLENSL